MPQSSLTDTRSPRSADTRPDRTVYPEVPPRVKYELTEIGYEFKPVLDSIELWGRKYIRHLEQKNSSFDRL